MKSKKSSLVNATSLLLLVLLGSGCSANNSSQPEVMLSESLRLDDYLAEDSVAEELTTDLLTSQLNSSWSFIIEVKSPEKENNQAVKSCADYLSADHQAEPLKAHEYTAYRALGISCEAVQQALSMQATKESFVRELKFDKALADQIPHDVALVISTEERKRLDANPDIRVWSDIETIETVEQLAPDVYSFKTAGATHTLKRLALGDANRDGIEDLLIRSDVNLDEGSYSASRLFLLTKRSANQDIEILKNF